MDAKKWINTEQEACPNHGEIPTNTLMILFGFPTTPTPAHSHPLFDSATALKRTKANKWRSQTGERKWRQKRFPFEEARKVIRYESSLDRLVTARGHEKA